MDRWERLKDAIIKTRDSPKRNKLFNNKRNPIVTITENETFNTILQAMEKIERELITHESKSSSQDNPNEQQSKA